MGKAKASTSTPDTEVSDVVSPADADPTELADDTTDDDTAAEDAPAEGHETEVGQLVTDAAGVQVGLVVSTDPIKVAWLGVAAPHEAPLFDFNAEDIVEAE